MGIGGFTISYLAFSVLHFILFILSLAVCGLYGQDLNHAHDEGKYSDSKWAYAVVVGALSAFTCVLYFIPLTMRFAGVGAVAWNMIMFILWIALFGVFGSLFIHEKAEGDGGIQRMKNAVWVDLTAALLWLVATIAAAGYWWKHRDSRSLFTGRAHV